MLVQPSTFVLYLLIIFITLLFVIVNGQLEEVSVAYKSCRLLCDRLHKKATSLSPFVTRFSPNHIITCYMYVIVSIMLLKDNEPFSIYMYLTINSLCVAGPCAAAGLSLECLCSVLKILVRLEEPNFKPGKARVRACVRVCVCACVRVCVCVCVCVCEDISIAMVTLMYGH